jgi:hypothetical protein
MILGTLSGMLGLATATGDDEALAVATGRTAVSLIDPVRPATARATTTTRQATQPPIQSPDGRVRPTGSNAPSSSPIDDLRQLRSMKTFFVSV